MTILIYILASAGCLAMAISAWSNSRARSTNRSFVTLSAVVMLTYLAFALSLLPHLDNLRVVYMACGMFTPVLTLWLVRQTFQTPDQALRHNISVLFMTTVVAVPALVISDVVFYAESGGTTPPGILASVFVLTGFGWPLLHLRDVSLSTKTIADKLRIRYLMVALSGAVLFMAIEHMGRVMAAPIDPSLLSFSNRGVLLQGPVPPISVFFSVAALYFLYHVQVHSRLLDLQDLLSRLVLLTSLAVTLVVIEVVAGYWLRVGVTGYALHATFQLFLGSFFFLVIYEPLRELYEHWVNRLINRRGQKLVGAIRSLSKNLGHSLTTDQLAHTVLEALHLSGRVDQVSLYLVHDMRAGFSLAGYRSNPDQPVPLSAVVDDRFVTGFEEHESWYTRGQLAHRDQPWVATARKLMLAMGADVTLPLYSGVTLVGWLNVSDLAWSVGYSGEDLRRFSTLADKIGFALSNIYGIETHERRMRLAALGEMSTGLAHEIRNPLAGIKGAAQYLQSENLADDAQEMLNVVVSEANRLNLVVSQFLDYARPYEVDAVEGDPNDLVRSTVQLLQAQRRDVDIVTELSDNLMPIVFDAAKMSQVLLNLCQNGLQAMDDDGTLTITTRRCVFRRNQLGVELLVHDTGPGFSDAVKENLFVPFFTKKRGGTGLGLAIVERIVAAHGGEIAAQSPPSGGALFVVRLPATILPRVT